MQQRGVRREQRHVRRDASAPAYLPEPVGQPTVQGEAMYGAAVGLNRCAWPVDGYPRVRGQLAGQLVTPVLPQAVAFGSRQHPCLPVRVVDVALWADRGRLSTVFCGVQLAQLVEDDVDGPEVDGDVMHRQDQYMLVGCGPEQCQPKHRAGLQIEWAIGLTTYPAVKLVG